MSRSSVYGTFAVTFVLILAPSAAEANMVLPLCILTWPIMVWSLVPVIALETLVVWVRAGLPLLTTAWLIAEANLASTVLGLPVVALLSTMIPGLARRGAIGRRKAVAEIMRLAWGSVGENRDDPGWVSMAAWLAVLFPFFLASWILEERVVVYLMGGRTVDRVWDAIRDANLLSYGLLAMTGFLTMAWHIRAARRTRAHAAELRPRAEEDAPRLEAVPPDLGLVGGRLDGHSHSTEAGERGCATWLPTRSARALPSSGMSIRSNARRPEARVASTTDPS